MKLFYALPFLFSIVFACKKEDPPNEIETPSLIEMKKNIVNTWKIFKVMTVKPISRFGEGGTLSCQDATTFNFKGDSTFYYIVDSSCFPGGSSVGFCNLASKDSLILDFRGPTHPGHTTNWRLLSCLLIL